MLQVSCGDDTRLINIKLIKYGLGLVSCQVLLQVDGGSNKLAVVDLLIILEVDLVDDLIELIGRHVHILFFDQLLQLLDFNESTVILVKLLELVVQLLDLGRFEVLDQDVDCCLLEQRLALKGLDALEDLAIVLGLLLLGHLDDDASLLGEFLDPIMV